MCSYSPKILWCLNSSQSAGVCSAGAVTPAHVCRINVSVFAAWRDAHALIRFLRVLQSAPKQSERNDCDVKTTPTCASWSFSSFPCDHKPFSLLRCCAQQPPMAHLSRLIFIYECQPVTWCSQTVKYWTMLYSSNNLGRFIVWFSSMLLFPISIEAADLWICGGNGSRKDLWISSQCSQMQ